MRQPEQQFPLSNLANTLRTPSPNGGGVRHFHIKQLSTVCLSIQVPYGIELQHFPVGNWKPIWIASFEISDPIREKIQAKHHVDPDELLDHLICSPSVRGRFVYNKEHGERYLIYVQVRPGKIFEVHANLIHSDYSAWSLRTARIIVKIPE